MKYESNHSADSEIGVRESKLRKLELVAILIAMGALSFDILWGLTVEQPRAAEDRAQAERTREFQAWMLLNNQSGGEGGKESALEFLADRGAIYGLDLSCGSSDLLDGNEHCSLPTYIGGLGREESVALHLEDSNLQHVRITNSDIPNSTFRTSDFSNAVFREVDFSDSVLEFVDLSNAKFERSNLARVKFKAVMFEGADLSSSNLVDADFSESGIPRSLKLHGANISGAVFSNRPVGVLSGRTVGNTGAVIVARGEQPDFRAIETAWAWSDALPTMPKSEFGPVICPASARSAVDSETEMPDVCVDEFNERMDAFFTQSGIKIIPRD
ncbi:MAG: pentapeptide repeat-containing protein [Pseudomonadota bacterium]